MPRRAGDGPIAGTGRTGDVGGVHGRTAQPASQRGAAGTLGDQGTGRYLSVGRRKLGIIQL